MMKKSHFSSLLAVGGLLLGMAFVPSLVSCSDDDNDKTSSEVVGSDNPAVFISDPAKLAMIRSMTDLDGTGRIYEIDYTADYHLQQVIDRGATDLKPMFGYIASLLYDNLSPSPLRVQYGAGCSAFAAPTPDGDFLMGRNYDFRHSDSTKARGRFYVPTCAIVVHTAPVGGKRSVSMVDGFNLGFGQGFYRNDSTDLSMLMGLPYAALDGINEDGFAIGVLALHEKQTNQQTGKKRIGTTTAIRMLLDRVSTVKEAVNMLRDYDMDMRGQGTSNYHFFMADATGDYAIVEYTTPKGGSEPSQMEVFTGNDTIRCVTNFYVSPTMVGTTDGWGSQHGRWRYDSLRVNLLANNYVLKKNAAWKLLQLVSQPPTQEITSQTQWSALYNLTEKKMNLSILREYAKKYSFKVKKTKKK